MGIIPENCPPGDRALPAVDVLSAAEEFAASGFQIVPLHNPGTGGCSCTAGARCESTGKHPRIREWPERATTDRATIREWFRRWPLANIGIATGRESGAVVVEGDLKSGGPETIARWQHENGPIETLMARSGGGGTHFYFQPPPFVVEGRSVVLTR
jgi:putative DNA primase/helicase